MPFLTLQFSGQREDLQIEVDENCNRLVGDPHRYLLFKAYDNMINVIVGVGVKEIPYELFADCIDLVSVTIPGTVTVIGENAFRGCNSLASVTLSEGLKTIQSGAFYYCRFLAAIYIPGSVTKIENYAFYRCESLVSFAIPVGVTRIGISTFQECESLISIKIPEGVKTIETGAFYGCNKLNSVSLPSTLEKITGGLIDDEDPFGAFQGCTSLASIIIPEKVTTIGEYVFYECTSLKSVHIRAGRMRVTIESEAFAYCGSLEVVRVDDKHARIHSDAFLNCDNIKFVNIYDTVKVLFRTINAQGQNRIEEKFLKEEYALPPYLEKPAWKYLFPSCKEENLRWRLNFPNFFRDSFVDRPTTLAAVQSIRRSVYAPQLPHMPLPFISREMIEGTLEHTK